MPSHARPGRHAALPLALPLAVALAARAARAVPPPPPHAVPEPPPPPPPRRWNGVHADLGLHVIGLAYERVVDDRVAVQLQGQLYVPWTIVPDVAGVAAQLRLYFFFIERAPAGLYVSPFARAGYVATRGAAPPADGNAFAGGVSAGYSFFLANRVVLRIGLGVQYVRLEVGSAVNHALHPTVDGSAGVAF